MASLVVLYFMNLPSFRTVLQMYSMKHFGLPLQTENQELIWLKFHKFPRFNNSKGNGIVGGKLVRPAIPCRVWFWPATGERLPIPGLEVWSWSRDFPFFESQSRRFEVLSRSRSQVHSLEALGTAKMWLSKTFVNECVFGLLCLQIRNNQSR